MEKVLREMAFDPKSVQGFDYGKFCMKIEAENLDKAQKKHFEMRQGLLKSFMREGIMRHTGGKKILDHVPANASIFDVDPGCLTIVDLTDPMLDGGAACSLFDICMSNYLREPKDYGRVVALDEAHKVCLISISVYERTR